MKPNNINILYYCAFTVPSHGVNISYILVYRILRAVSCSKNKHFLEEVKPLSWARTGRKGHRFRALPWSRVPQAAKS